jgi:hydrogenase nickel incorporation protein HypA/HybF
MHELALSRAIVDAALRHAEGRPVERVHVRLGSMRQAVPRSLAFYFEILARETDCEGAVLEIETLDGEALEVDWIEVEEAKEAAHA